eukprot:525704_1
MSNPYASSKNNPYASSKSNPYSSSTSNPYSSSKKNKYVTDEKDDDEKGGMTYKSSSMVLSNSSLQIKGNSMSLYKSSMKLSGSSVKKLASSMQLNLSSLTLRDVYGRLDDDTIFRILCGVASVVMMVGGAALIYVSGGTSGFMLTAGISLATTGISKGVDCVVAPKFNPLNFIKDVVIAAGLTVLTFGMGKGIDKVIVARTNALRQQIFQATETMVEYGQNARATAGCILLKHYDFAIKKIHLQAIAKNMKTAVSSIVNSGEYVIECAISHSKVDLIILTAKNGAQFLPDKCYPDVASIAVDLALKAK